MRMNTSVLQKNFVLVVSKEQKIDSLNGYHNKSQ